MSQSSLCLLMEKKKVGLLVPLDPKTHAALRVFAEKNRRSMAKSVVLLIEQAVLPASK